MTHTDQSRAREMWSWSGFQLSVESNSPYFALICIITLICDWLEKLAPLSQNPNQPCADVDLELIYLITHSVKIVFL